jgi:hypothetical protein
MSTKMPLPAPPRSPTPPPDEDAPPAVGLGFDGDLPVGPMASNPHALLSPISATFPSKQYATLGPSDSVSQRASPATMYTPASATFPYTPMTAASGTTDAEGLSVNGSENRNPFNFQSVAYQPGRPQSKTNVRHSPHTQSDDTNNLRMSAVDEGTSTSTVVSPIRSSSNPHRALLYNSLHRSRFRRSKNTGRPCPRTRSYG